MTQASARAVILFARDPVEGQVKTRLSSLLDPSTIVSLYRQFLRDSIEKICAVPDADPFIGIATDPQTGYFDEVSRDHVVRLFVQKGENLGERMRQAFADRFKEGYERVVIIGSDSPTLPVSYITQALQSEKEVVIGPSTDGGYYLVGMRGKVTDIFKRVAWGTDSVLSETLHALKDQQAEAELLPVWYDVDLPGDLYFLKTHLEWMSHAGLQEGSATLEFLNHLQLKPIQ